MESSVVSSEALRRGFKEPWTLTESLRLGSQETEEFSRRDTSLTFIQNMSFSIPPREKRLGVFPQSLISEEENGGSVTCRTQMRGVRSLSFTSVSRVVTRRRERERPGKGSSKDYRSFLHPEQK